MKLLFVWNVTEKWSKSALQVLSSKFIGQFKEQSFLETGENGFSLLLIYENVNIDLPFGISNYDYIYSLFVT